MNELQALVTGMLIGSLMKQRQVDLTLEPQYDDDGNYLPEFVVVGNITDTKLRIKVELDGGARDLRALGGAHRERDRILHLPQGHQKDGEREAALRESQGFVRTSAGIRGGDRVSEKEWT